jgi:hypothetical protein
MKDILTKTLVLAAVLVTQTALAAGTFGDYDVDPRFRAKIMKEKAKQNQLQATNFNFTNGNGADSAQCGSQNIGNVDTGGRIGTAPREVFVFAPNAINLVPTGGCK